MLVVADIFTVENLVITCTLLSCSVIMKENSLLTLVSSSAMSSSSATHCTTASPHRPLPPSTALSGETSSCHPLKKTFSLCSSNQTVTSKNNSICVHCRPQNHHCHMYHYLENFPSIIHVALLWSCCITKLCIPLQKPYVLCSPLHWPTAHSCWGISCAGQFPVWSVSQTTPIWKPSWLEWPLVTSSLSKPQPITLQGGESWLL